MVLWKQQGNKTRGPVCDIQPESAGPPKYQRAAFPTPPTAIHHPVIRAVRLFSMQKGKKGGTKIREGR